VSVAALIATQRAEYGIAHAVSCRALGVSPAWFYKWRAGDASLRRKRRDALAAQVAWLFAKHQGTYGSPRITADLREAGWKVSHNTVATLMAEQQLIARPKPKRRSTTRADKRARKAPDALKRDFTPPERRDVRWCGDLTEIPTGEGTLYLAAVLDLHSRRCVGFALGAHHDAELARAALCVAIAIRGGDVAGVIFHTDQGSEYTAELFAHACASAEVTQSMGRTGSALDKGLASHCTSWCGWGTLCCRDSFRELAALLLVGRVGAGGRVEPLVLVVGLVAVEQPGGLPALDGGGVHAEAFGELVAGEHPRGLEPLVSTGQAVRAA
jgi:putative transposase